MSAGDDPRQITTALGGRWHRSYGVAPCPICQPERRKEQSALSIMSSQDGRLLLNCKKGFCDFAAILDALRGMGLVSGRSDYIPPNAAELAALKEAAKVEANRKAEQALAIWKAAGPIHGTAAETYLRGRGITRELPRTLRYQSECWHSTGKRPAMIAAVQGTGRACVHRTYLRPDGNGKAEIEPNKMMLGAASGGAVRLAEAEGPLVVCEGIETGLSLASGLLRKPATVWAALSAPGMKSLILPAVSGRLTIATDGDKAGRDAGQALADRAYAAGWAVSFLHAPDGRDWNDVLTANGVAA